jgi:DNA-binding CsgD family transcriptional regulator
VLDHLSQGFLYKEIAEKMGISYETVHTYIRRIYEKSASAHAHGGGGESFCT